MTIHYKAKVVSKLDVVKYIIPVAAKLVNSRSSASRDSPHRRNTSSSSLHVKGAAQ